MHFKPLGKRVVLKREEQLSKTKSGILLTHSGSEKPAFGTVVSVSTELNEHAHLLNKVVAFKEYKTNEIKLDNQEYLVVEYEDILGVIEN